MAAGGSTHQHWPGLDGLRGIAALAVLLFHAQLGLAVNGYVGVDVFFALSGFLITSILLGEHARTGGLRLGRFYVRRGPAPVPGAGRSRSPGGCGRTGHGADR